MKRFFYKKKIIFRTPPITIEEALAAILTKTPVKENSAFFTNKTPKKTPLSKFQKKSPMPSPFLGSPGTPSKDTSIGDLSYNYEEIHVTPSIIPNVSRASPACAGNNTLSLEISPEPSGLNTPSPISEKEGPLITPPLAGKSLIN